MNFRTLISADQLAAILPSVIAFDCRHRLAEPEFGYNAYLEGHIPGARFAHLDKDLAAPVVPGQTGRHPLPDVDTFVKFLCDAGVSNSSTLVAYDDAGGAFAARFWWMLRWLGHDNVAVLDGGFPAWVAAGGRVESGPPAVIDRGSFEPTIRNSMIVTADVIATQLNQAARDAHDELILLDARAPDRYDGSNETIDPIGGHIPGALSLPFADNLDERGFFRGAAELRARFNDVLDDPGQTTPTVVSYCGSGVTAAHNILAMVHAGLPEPVLYPGSWSEWITDPDRPVESGSRR